MVAKESIRGRELALSEVEGAYAPHFPEGSGGNAWASRFRKRAFGKEMTAGEFSVRSSLSSTQKAGSSTPWNGSQASPSPALGMTGLRRSLFR